MSKSYNLKSAFRLYDFNKLEFQKRLCKLAGAIITTDGKVFAPGDPPQALISQTYETCACLHCMEIPLTGDHIFYELNQIFFNFLFLTMKILLE